LESAANPEITTVEATRIPETEMRARATEFFKARGAELRCTRTTGARHGTSHHITRPGIGRAPALLLLLRTCDRGCHGAGKRKRKEGWCPLVHGTPDRT